MSIQILHNSRCRKSRESLQYLEQNGFDVEIIDYLNIELSHDFLKDLLIKLDIPAAQLIRKTEAIYKSTYKGQKIDEKGWITAMIEHPKLIQRPIIISGDEAVIGRPLEALIDFMK